SVKAWVNGLATADVLDTLDLSGKIALQIHSGNNSAMRWRQLRLTDLGQHQWVTWLGVGSVTEWTTGGPGWRTTAEGLAPHESSSVHGPAVLLSPTMVKDTALQLRYRSAGQLALILAAPTEPPAGDGSEPLPLAPGLHALPRVGLLVRPPATDGWADLSVSLAGGRVAVHVDGTLLGERLHGITSAARLVVLAEGPDCAVAQLKRLVPGGGSAAANSRSR
ncbi:MAG: hypothetical protein ACI9EF_002279, partial [Pseudohongiellaceae bacterium]